MPDIDWKNEVVKMYPTHGVQCQQLLTTAKDHFLEQVVTEPTRTTETTSSVLDLFFTNNNTLVNQVHVIPGIADHDAVFIESSLRPMKKKISPRRVYLYRKADFGSFNKDLASITEEIIITKN